MKYIRSKIIIYLLTFYLIVYICMFALNQFKLIVKISFSPFVTLQVAALRHNSEVFESDSVTEKVARSKAELSEPD